MLQVCSPFYNYALGISKTRYLKLCKKAPAGRVHAVKVIRKAPYSEKNRNVRGFLHQYIKENGQYVPNKDESHLPSVMTKLEIHGKYKKQYPGEHMTLASFGRIWTKYHPRAKILPSSNFAKCTKCTKARETIEAVGVGEYRGNISIHILHL